MFVLLDINVTTHNMILFKLLAPLKGIPSRVPTSGFRSPSLTSSMPNRTSINRIRKDGGIKLLEITEQPLGYAQAKKRKRMLELEEQQKKVAEAQAAAAAAAASTASPVPDTPTTPEYAQGLTSINPATPVAPAVATPQPYVAPSTPSSITTTPQTRKTNIVTFFCSDFNCVLLLLFLLYSHYANHTYDVYPCDNTDNHTDSDNVCRNYTCRCANGQTSSDSDTDSYTNYSTA